MMAIPSSWFRLAAPPWHREEPRLRLLFPQLFHLGEFGFRILFAAERKEESAQTVVGIRLRRIQADRLAEVPLRCRGIARRGQHDTKVQVREPQPRVQLLGLPQVIRGLLVVAHVHLGKSADLAEIHWPSGIVQELKNVPVDRVLKVKEPAK